MGYIYKPENNNKEHDFLGGRGNTYFAKVEQYFYRTEDKVEEIAFPGDQEVHVKFNKYGDWRFSLFEAMNSKFVRRIMGKDRTPECFLVVEPEDSTKIVGFASKKMDIEPFMKHPLKVKWDAVNKADAAAIIMGTAIGKGDDPHKDNVGMQKETDHLRCWDQDMKNYPIYSRFGKGGRWFFHPFSTNRHSMTPDDLTNFPVTKRFDPHYWFSQTTFFGVANKNYYHKDYKAMKTFAADDEFNKEKYYTVLQFILTPESVQRAEYEEFKQWDESLYWTMLHAEKETQAEWMALALGTPAFRQAIVDHKDEYAERLQAFFEEYNPGEDFDFNDSFGKLCEVSAKCEENQDTPLHAAIRSDAFRYHETMDLYGEYAGVKNGDGKTPMELAGELNQDGTVEFLNGNKNYLTVNARAIIGGATLVNLHEQLQALTDDLNIPLKMKKNAVILIFKRILPQLNTCAQLHALDEILHRPENTFIRQLTSRYEITRFLRGRKEGLYGVTSTYKTIVNLIGARTKELLATEEHDAALNAQGRDLMKRYYKQTHTFFGKCMKEVDIELPEELKMNLVV